MHESFGTNWRLTEMQSIIGRMQLQKLPSWRSTRQKHAAVLTRHFSAISALRTTIPGPHAGHAYYKYYAFVRPERLKEGWNRDRIMAAINAEGIPCFSGSCGEIYLEEAFARRGVRPGTRLPVAQQLGATSLMFLVHPTLSGKELDDTCRAVVKVFAVAAD